MDRYEGRFSFPKVSVTVVVSDGRTKQCFAKDADINTIVKRYTKGGVLSTGFVGDRVPSFGDFSSGADFMAVHNSILQARKDFDELPIDVKVRFSHDPAKLFDFMADAANHAECQKLGLLAPDPVVPGPIVSSEVVKPAQ